MQSYYSQQPYFDAEPSYYTTNFYTNSTTLKASSEKSTQSQSQYDFDNENCYKNFGANIHHKKYPQSQTKKVLQNSQNSKYKIQLCRNFKLYGTCPYGIRCQYAHGESQLRSNNKQIDPENCQEEILKTNQKYKTKMCRDFFKKGFCSYGETCNYLHRAKCSKNTENKPKNFDAGFLQIKMESRRQSTLMRLLNGELSA